MAFFLVGIFNNNGYVMIQAGSASIAKSFGESDFMSGFQFAMTFVSILTRYANGTVLVNVPHLTRARVVTLLQFLSFTGIAVASHF